MTNNATPLAVTVPQACRLSGYGPTTIWALVRDGRLRAVRVDGIRRTLIDYGSLARLLLPPEPPDTPQPRRRGRPRKIGHSTGAQL
jgi:excisionase family DNA binding protein